MPTHVKIAAVIAGGTFVCMLVLAAVGGFLERRGIVSGTPAVQAIAKITGGTLCLILFLAAVPVMVHIVVAAQAGGPGGGSAQAAFFKNHELAICGGIWGLALAGLVVALPGMIAENFPRRLKSEGVLRANIGMALDAVRTTSTFKLGPGAHITDYDTVSGGGVFDLEVAGTGLRFENCRYYMLQTGDHDSPLLVSMNIGLSPQKMSAAELRDFEREVTRRLVADQWMPGHYVWKTQRDLQLGGGKPTSGDGKYWARDGTLMILNTKRMDDAKPGEPPEAGEFILFVDMVPRNERIYSKLVFEPSAAWAQTQP